MSDQITADYEQSGIPSFGERVPYFHAASERNPAFQFSSLGGKWIVLIFHGSLESSAAQSAYRALDQHRALFDDIDAQLFGVTTDPQDVQARGLRNAMPGVRYFWDYDKAVSKLYGLTQQDSYVPTAFLLDRTLRVADMCPLTDVEALLGKLKGCLAEEKAEPVGHAPVLMIPRVFEPEFCAELIEFYRHTGGSNSGFMTTVDGRTVGVFDAQRKRRTDVVIPAGHELENAAALKISRRLVPAIRFALGARMTRIERFLIARYSDVDRGFFMAHRDNTTAGTAHRQFAVTINLNSPDYDGGDLCFPEFGSKLYRPVTGAAAVFSCNLLHEVLPLKAGTRYAFLPFLYDEAGRLLRKKNQHLIDDAKPNPAN